MKKVWVLILVMISFFEVFSMLPRRATVGAGNDFFSFGLSRNDDDQKSFSEHFGYEGDRWTLKLDFESVTNRGWREGWRVTDETISSDSPDFYRGRYDTISLSGDLSFDFKLTQNLDLAFKPKIGIYLIGNLNMDFFQNWLHQVRAIHIVELPYDYSSYQLSTLGGAIFELNYDFYQFEKHSLVFSAKSEFSFIPNLSSNDYFGAEISLRRGLLKPVTLSLGYSINKSWSTSRTEKLLAEHLNGFRYGFGIDSGFLTVKYENCSQSRFGYGTVSLDILSFLRESNWRETNIRLKFGSKVTLLDPYIMLGLEYCWNNKWALAVESSSVSGQPLDNLSEVQSNLFLEPRVKKNNNLFSIGVKRNFILPEEFEGWLTPYAYFDIGFARWSLYHITNMIETSSLPSTTDVDYLSFFTEFLGGITVIPQGVLLTDSSTVQFDIFAGALHLPYISQDYPKENNKYFSPVFGFCLNVGIDL